MGRVRRGVLSQAGDTRYQGFRRFSSPSRADRTIKLPGLTYEQVSICCCLPPYAERHSYGKVSRMETEGSP